MKVFIASTTTRSRAVRIAAATLLTTCLIFTWFLLELDNVGALHRAYGESWDAVQVLQDAGKTDEAVRLASAIRTIEQGRITRDSGWFHLFEGPDLMWRAMIHEARALAAQKDPAAADAAYRDLLALVTAEYPKDGGRNLMTLVLYAGYLADRGRWPEAANHLDEADRIIQANLANSAYGNGWKLQFNEADYGTYGLAYQRELSGRIRELRSSHSESGS